MPVIVPGTWTLSDGEAESSVYYALQSWITIIEEGAE